MLHTVYLAGLCQRRQWSEPFYQVASTQKGYTCIVRVNNREYQTARAHSSENTAKEGAALIAFNICRSFSVNNGMYPDGFAHDNIVQGRAVPIGAPASRRNDGNRSGGSSPDFSDDSTTSARGYTLREPVTYASLRQETFLRRGPIRT